VVVHCVGFWESSANAAAGALRGPRAGLVLPGFPVVYGGFYWYVFTLQYGSGWQVERDCGEVGCFGDLCYPRLDLVLERLVVEEGNGQASVRAWDCLFAEGHY